MARASGARSLALPLALAATFLLYCLDASTVQLRYRLQYYAQLVLSVAKYTVAKRKAQVIRDCFSSGIIAVLVEVWLALGVH